LIAGDFSKLSRTQSIPYFCFWYDSEVQNGGHLQFSENTSIHYQDKDKNAISLTLKALKNIGARKQANILSQASRRYFAQKEEHPATVKEFVDLALEDEFEEIDERYYNCSPDINYYLEKYLQTLMTEFVKIS
jgi:hypothetical protein